MVEREKGSGRPLPTGREDGTGSPTDSQSKRTPTVPESPMTGVREILSISVEVVQVSGGDGRPRNVDVKQRCEKTERNESSPGETGSFFDIH